LEDLTDSLKSKNPPPPAAGKRDLKAKEISKKIKRKEEC
jgi:hypothetical protein